MIQSHHTLSPQHLKFVYTGISIILVAPILLWPLPALFFDNPMLMDAVLPKWNLSIIIMLVTCITMDTVLYGINSLKQSIHAISWLTIPSIIIIQHQDYTWLLAVLILAHSLRSAYMLLFCMEHTSWWVNTAWLRDIVTVIIVLTWLQVLPT